MSKTVDSRVVEMRFDNKAFESGAKETMSTLEKLKAALSSTNSATAFENLDKATENVKLDGIASGIEALQNRFSTLGIVGMRVIENLTDGFMNKLSSAVSWVSDSIVSGGLKRAQNIENAHFQLQALLKDESKVQAVMDDAMTSVDGTAYAYDEAAKAAAQFAASGLEAGDEMLGALKGITGVAAMTNSSFEDISNIFTTVAGNGRLMGDQLLQLSGRGLNAASTLADYYKEVGNQSDMTEAKVRDMVSSGKVSFNDFAAAMQWAFGESAERANETFTGSLSNMKSALARIGAGFFSPLIEQNGELVKLFNALRIQINNVKSALVFDETKSAISGLAEATGLTNERLTTMFDNIDKKGSVGIKSMQKLKKNGVDSYGTLATYMSNVNNGSQRATYAITSAVNDISKELILADKDTKKAVESGEANIDDLVANYKLSSKQVKKLVKEGKIDASTFVSAMETSYGNSMALSKQVTDSLQDIIQKVRETINNTDLSTAMETFYYNVESIKNVFKGLWTVVKPMGKAFDETFLSFSGDDVVKLADQFESLTAKMRLSEDQSENVHDAFKGVFDVAKLLINVILDIAGVSTSAAKPIGSLADGALSLAGALGRGLSAFAGWAAESETLTAIANLLASAFRWAMDALNSLIVSIVSFSKEVAGLEETKKLIAAIQKLFTKLGEKIAPLFKEASESVGEFRENTENMVPDATKDAIEWLADMIDKLADNVDAIDFSGVSRTFGDFIDKIKSLKTELGAKGSGLTSYLDNLKQFGANAKDAISFDKLIDNLEKFQTTVDGFITWFKEKVAPTFSDMSIGGVVAGGSGIAMVYSLVTVANSLSKLSDSVKSIPSTFGAIRKTLESYQTELKAKALKEVAAAILILAAALVAMSFADQDKIMAASVSLSLIASVLLSGVTKLKAATSRSITAVDALQTFASKIGTAANTLAKAVKWKAIGSTFKSFGVAILLVAASIISLGLMYKKDPAAFTAATTVVSKIALVMGAIVAVIGLVSGKFASATNGLSKAATSIIAIAASLYLVVVSLKKLFKTELPADYQVKLDILSGLLIELAAIVVLLGACAKAFSANGESLKVGSTLIALAVMLYATIGALNKLFKIELPTDYKTKLGIMASIFVLLGAVLVAIGYAGKLAGGKIKALGTILAVCVYLVVAVAAIYVLSLQPWDSLLKGVLSLSAVLVALGIALAGAGQITETGSYKSVLAMAVVVAAVTAALGVLSMVPMEKLAKAGAALGAMLLVLAVDMNAAGKLSGEGMWKNITAMCAALVLIAGSLVILAAQPWQNLLAAAGAMSATLLAFAAAFEIMMKRNWSANYQKKATAFLEASLIMIPIAAALYILAGKPWESLISAAVALSGTLLAFSAAYTIMLSTNWSSGYQKKIYAFLEASLAVIPIAAAIAVLASYDWAGILAAAVGLSAVLLVLAGALAILGVTQVNIANGAAFLVASLALIPIAAAIAVLASYNWDQMWPAVASLGLVLAEMVAALAILGLLNVGAIAGAASLLVGALALIPIANAIQTLAGYKWSSLLPAVGTLGLVLLELIAAMAVLGLLSPLVLPGAIALAAAAVALLPIASAIQTLAGIPYEEACNGLTILTQTLTILGVAAVSAVVVAPLLLTLSAAIVVFSGALITLGVGIVAITTSILLAINLLNSLSSLITGGVGEFVNAGANLMAGFIAGILSGVQSVISTVADMASSVVDTVCSVLGIHSPSTIFEMLGINTDLGFANGVEDGSSSITSSMTDVFGSLSDYIDTDQLSGTGADTVTSFISGMSGNSSKVDDAVIEYVDPSDIQPSMDPYEQIGSDASDAVADGVSSNDISSELQSMLGNSTSGVDLSAFDDLGLDSISSFTSSFDSGSTDITSSMTDTLGDSAANVDTSTFESVGADAASSMRLGMMNSAKSKSGPAMKSVAASIKKVLSSAVSSQNFDAAGAKMATTLCSAITKGISAKKPTLVNSARSASEAVANKFKAMLNTETYKPIGEKVSSAIAIGIADTESKTTLLNRIKGLCTYIQAQWNSNVTTIEPNLKNRMHALGVNIAQGLANGIRANISAVTAASKAMANQVDKAVTVVLQIHSPSKLAKLRGYQWVLGFAQGLEENTALIEAATGKAFDAATWNRKKNLGIYARQLAFGLDKTILVQVRDTAKEYANATKTVQKAQKNVSKLEYQIWKTNNKITKEVASANKATKKTYEKDIAQMDSDYEKAKKQIENRYSALGTLTSAQKKAKEKELNALEKAYNRSKSIREAAYDDEVEQNEKEITVKYQQALLTEEYYDFLTKQMSTGYNKMKYEGKTVLDYAQDMLSNAEEIVSEYVDLIDDSRDSFMNSLDLFSTEIQDKESSIVSAMGSIFDAVTSSETDYTSSMSGIFDTWSEKSATASTDLFTNIEAQIAAQDRYISVMNNLDSRLDGTGLLKYLNTLGVDSVAQLEVISAMTDEELQKYAAKYEESYAKTALIAQRTNEQVTAATLQKNIDDQIAAEKEYNDTMATLTSRLDGTHLLTYLNTLGEDSIDTLKVIANMTDAQLDQYIASVDEKFALAQQKEEESSKITADQILANAKADLAEREKYISLMNSLSTRLDDTDLLAYLKTLGMDSLDQLEAINSMTDSQLAELVSSYNTSEAYATEQARIANKERIEDLTEELSELFGIDIDIEEFAANWDGTLKGLLKLVKSNTEEVVTSEVKKSTKSVVSSAAKDGTSTVTSAVKSSNKKVVSNTSSSNKSTGKSMAKDVVSGVTSQSKSFYNAGSSNAQSYIDGLNSKTASLKSALAAYQMAVAAQASATASYSSGYTIGTSVGSGISNGTVATLRSVSSSVSTVTSAMVSTANSNLSIHSPSKVFAQIGTYCGIGLINGLMQMVAKVANASQTLTGELTNAATDQMNQVRQVFDDESLTLRPEVDLSNVYDSMDEITELFNNAINRTAWTVHSAAEAVSTGKAAKTKEESASNTTKAGDTYYQFEQNNYSPKALNRYEVYRQTRNQIKQIKEVAKV